MLTTEQKKLIEELYPNLSFLDLPEDLQEHFLESGGLEASQLNLFDFKFNAICSCGLKFKRIKYIVSECPVCRNTKFKPVKVKVPAIKKIIESDKRDFSKLSFGKKSFGKRYKFYFENNEIKVFNLEQMYELNWFTNEVNISSDKKEVYQGKIFIENERVIYQDINNRKMNIILFVHLLPKLSVKEFIQNYNLLVSSKPLFYVENMTRLSVMNMLTDERIRILSELFNDYMYIYLTEDVVMNNGYKCPKTMVRESIPLNNSIDKLSEGFNSGVFKETPINEKTLNAYELLDLPKSIVKWMVNYYQENKKNLDWTKSDFIFSVLNIYQKENKNTGLTLNLLNLFYSDKQVSARRINDILIPKFYFLVNNNHKSSQLLNYMKNEFEKQIFTIDNGLTYYEDYVRMSLLMEVPYTKYPKNLDKVHDVRAKDYKVVISKEESRLFKKVYTDNPLKENVVDDYTFVTPKSTKDLVVEGQQLKHCVASYVNRVVKNESLIYMMRETNDIEKSFITIEVVKGNIVQVRGKHNASPPTDVKQIVKKWATLNRFRYVY